jgi:hypothetical protein
MFELSVNGVLSVPMDGSVPSKSHRKTTTNEKNTTRLPLAAIAISFFTGSYEIVSVLGQVLASGKWNAQKSISVEGLGNGVYILNLKTIESGSVAFKIVKE